MKTFNLWKWVGSVQVAMILVSVIALVSFLGAWLPAELQPVVYYSWWFLLLLVLFSINLLICCLSRIFTSRTKFASALTHAAVLVILLGSLISYTRTQRGVLELQQGQSADSMLLKGRRHLLGFKVRLEEFSLAWYATGPAAYAIRYKVQDKQIRGALTLRLNEDYRIAGTPYAIEIAEYMPDFGLNENNIPVNRSPQPNNPAILVKVKTPGFTEGRWVFAKHPEFSFAKDENIQFRFDWEPIIREFASTVTFLDGERQTHTVIKVNHPAVFKGYTFYQSGYDADNLAFTSLEVVRDPGVPVVFCGFLMINLGLILLFLPKIAVLSARKREDRA